MLKRVRRFSLPLLLALGGVVALSASSARRIFATEKSPLRIAISPWPGYEFASLAAEKGYFQRENVAVELVELSTLGDCRRVFERGQVDGFFGTTVELAVARLLGHRQVEPVLVTDYSDGADVILARPPLRAISELTGKTVGVEQGSINVYLLSRALERAQLPWNTVRVVHVSPAHMLEALRSGEVDAVATYPPFALEIERELRANRLFSSDSLPGEIVDILCVDQNLVASRAADLAAFNRAFHAAMRYALENEGDAYRLMAERERTTVEEFRAAIRGGIRFVGSDKQSQFLGPQGSLKNALTRAEDVARRHVTLDKSGAP